MSDLVYQNYNNRCRGWPNPSNLFFGPEIISLTGYQSPAGSNTLISIVGANFFSYSVVRFGTFTPTVYFINSTLLSFYVPNTLTSGTYPVQVCNGSVCSNIINYTIDMASGYWMINSGGNTNTISNTNPNGVQVSWLTRCNNSGPVFLQNSDGSNDYPNSHPYKIKNTDNWIICDGNGYNIYVTLPVGQIYIGRELMFKVYNNFVLSNIPNVISFDGGEPDYNIIDSGYRWVTIINKDGTLWEIMQRGS